MRKYTIILFSAFFVFISCQTSKDRTDRIDILYSDGCTNGSFLCPANVLFECIDHNWKLLQYCDLQTCNYITGKCEGEIDDTVNTDDADSTDDDVDDDDTGNTGDVDSVVDDADDDAGNTGLDEDAGNTGNTGSNFPNEHDGLNWSDASSGGTTWDSATTYCEILGGRLPTISELRTLIQNCPATETGGACGATDSCLSYNECWNDNCGGCEYDESGKYSVFGDVGWLWSSLSDVSSPDSAWGVYFGYGGVFNYGKTSSDRARCVL